MIQKIHNTIWPVMSLFLFISATVLIDYVEVMACGSAYDQCALPVEPGSIYATIIGIKGDVTITSGGAVYKAALNDKLFPGDKVDVSSSGKNAVQIEFPDGTLLNIGKGTSKILEPKDFKDSIGAEHKIEVRDGVFRVVGGEIPAIGTEKRESLSAGSAMGIRGTIYLFTEDTIDGWAEYSVLEGQLEIDGIDWSALPDAFFTDPTNKSVETIDLAQVYQEVNDVTSFVDVIGIGTPLFLDAGYWTHIDFGQPPTPPQLGIAPSQQDFVNYVYPCNVCIPEPSSLLLLGAGLAGIGIMRCKLRIFSRLPGIQKYATKGVEKR